MQRGALSKVDNCHCTGDLIDVPKGLQVKAAKDTSARSLWARISHGVACKEAPEFRRRASIVVHTQLQLLAAKRCAALHTHLQCDVIKRRPDTKLRKLQ